MFTVILPFIEDIWSTTELRDYCRMYSTLCRSVDGAQRLGGGMREEELRRLPRLEVCARVRQPRTSETSRLTL